MRKLIYCSIPLILLLATPAHAYVGPGAGAGVVAVVLGVIGSIFLALVGIIWYPFKRLLKALRSRSKKSEQKDIKSDEVDTDNSNVHCSGRTGSSSASR